MTCMQIICYNLWALYFRQVGSSFVNAIANALHPARLVTILIIVLDVSWDVVSTLNLDSLLTLNFKQLEQVVEYDAVSIHLLVGDHSHHAQSEHNHQG